MRAAVCLARLHGPGVVRSAEMARATGIPANYLSKILHQLGREGIVSSERGRSGGFRLVRDPADVTLAEVVAPFEPQVERNRCLLGRPECSDGNPCGAHLGWKKIRGATIDFLENTTLYDVIRADPDRNRDGS
ncbi:MAG: Rrf2 family transcriptional regulator, partial [Candidatus Palauibacterales bacterium]|nr:Rrf2 family transcriptional regulator [Candidatus Palauibacterales bacterium]